MKWLIDNWSLLVVIVCAAAVVFVYIKKFADLPSEEQLAKVKSALLYLCIEAEKELGSKTGSAKLSYVYGKFVELFPSLAPVIPFTLFSSMVDEVLSQMRNMLESNKNLSEYVGGK